MKTKSLLSVCLVLLFSISSFAQYSTTGNQTQKSVLDAEYILSWDVCPTANTAQFRQEYYSVWISTTGNQPVEFTTMLFDETLLTTHTNWEYENRMVGLDDYANEVVYVAFRHHDITDMDRIVIDNVKLFKTDGTGKEELVFLFEDFQGGIDDPLGEDWLPAGWTTVDHDGDGLNWYYGVRNEVEGAMRSESWDGTNAVTPDNWLITPSVLLGTIGIGELSVNKIRVHPNPAYEFINISNLEGIDKVDFMNTMGKVVKTIHVGDENRITVPVNDLARGIYFLGFYSGDKVVETRKVLKN